MDVGRQVGVVMGEKIGYHDAEQAVRLEVAANLADEANRVGHEIDRVRDLDKRIVRRQFELLDWPDTGADAELAMIGLGDGIDVDALRLPAIVGKFAHGLAEAAADVDKSPERPGRQRGEEFI